MDPFAAVRAARDDARRNPATPRAFRGDAPGREVYPESVYLRRWAADQANRYLDLLETISAARAGER